MQPVAVDIVVLVTGMAQLVESTTGPQIHVVVHAADHVPYANADPNQLEMAILNLSVNARDAMVDGGTLRILSLAKRLGRAIGRGSQKEATSASPSLTPEQACPRRSRPALSNHFSRPKASARGQVWGCQWCMGWRFSSAER